MGTFLLWMGIVFGIGAFVVFNASTNAVGQIVSCLFGLGGVVMFASAFICTAIERLRTTYVEMNPEKHAAAAARLKATQDGEA